MKMMSPPKMHFLLSSTLLIVILVMDTGRNANGQEEPPQQQPNQPACQTDGITCGLGGHKLTTDGVAFTVTLADGSRKADEKKKDVENYQKSGSGTFKGCKVTKDKEAGFIVVHYDEKAATEGCAVDFITKKVDPQTKEDMANKIKFAASVKDPSCLTDNDCSKTPGGEIVATNDNSLPFVFSRSNVKVKELLNGPIYFEKGKGTCDKASCEQKSAEQDCISFTALEIRWSKCGTGTDMEIKAYLHQVGEPNIIEATLEGTNEKEATMDISGTVSKDGASYTYLDDAAKPVCTPGKSKGIPVPKAWPIVNSVDDTLKDFYLFVFHMLPQTATRKYGKDAKATTTMTKDSSAGEGIPKCMKEKDDGLSFKFPMAIYTDLLFTPPPSTTTPMPTTTTTSMTTTGIPTTGTGTSDEMTTSNNITDGKDKTTNSSPSPSGQPDKEKCKKEPLFLVSVISAAVLLVTTIGLIIVIIITCRKLNQAKAAGPIEDGDGAGSKKDEDDGEEEEEDDEGNKTEEADGNKSLASESVVPASSEEPYSVDHLLAPPGWVRPPRGKTAPPPQFKSGGPYPGGYTYKGGSKG